MLCEAVESNVGFATLAHSAMRVESNANRVCAHVKATLCHVCARRKQRPSLTVERNAQRQASMASLCDFQARRKQRSAIRVGNNSPRCAPKAMLGDLRTPRKKHSSMRVANHAKRWSTQATRWMCVEGNAEGRPFTAAVRLNGDGSVLPESAVSTVQLDGNTVSFDVSYLDMGAPAAGSAIHNLRMLSADGDTGAPLPGILHRSP